MERWRTDSAPSAGWFGSGYNHWGVQTNPKYASAAAVVAVHHDDSTDAVVRFLAAGLGGRELITQEEVLGFLSIPLMQARVIERHRLR